MLRNIEKLGYTSPRPYIATKNIQANKFKKKSYIILKKHYFILGL